MDGELQAKKAREKQSEVQVDMPRSSSLHAVHFRIICFAIKAERMILPFSKLLENGYELEKTINTKKFRIFRSFSAVYYLPHSDKVFINYGKNMFLSIFKTDIKP